MQTRFTLAPSCVNVQALTLVVPLMSLTSFQLPESLASAAMAGIEKANSVTAIHFLVFLML
ncbi:MAG: hypothetical protein ABSC47_06010 [Terracidiphilus sp.]